VYIYLDIRQSINWRNTGPNLPDFLRIGDVGWGYILHTSLQAAFAPGDTSAINLVGLLSIQWSESHLFPANAIWLEPRSIVSPR
jgi:hypothetical protein